jgi:hypothetical protein
MWNLGMIKLWGWWMEGGIRPKPFSDNPEVEFMNVKGLREFEEI